MSVPSARLALRPATRPAPPARRPGRACDDDGSAPTAGPGATCAAVVSLDRRACRRSAAPSAPARPSSRRTAGHRERVARFSARLLVALVGGVGAEPARRDWALGGRRRVVPPASAGRARTSALAHRCGPVPTQLRLLTRPLPGARPSLARRRSTSADPAPARSTGPVWTAARSRARAHRLRLAAGPAARSAARARRPRRRSARGRRAAPRPDDPRRGHRRRRHCASAGGRGPCGRRHAAIVGLPCVVRS